MQKDFTSQPWASGPAEILQHGIELLATKDSDKNRRLAIISIDNSVELMIKSYLNLPKRITGLELSRNQQSIEGFPKLLDALEIHASDKLVGIDLGEIEWYHRLRNQLYHEGNGLTVERTKVEVYATVAKLLFKNLYNIDLIIDDKQAKDPFMIFMNLWVQLEQQLSLLFPGDNKLRSHRDYQNLLTQLEVEQKLSPIYSKYYHELRQTRNHLVHGGLDINETVTDDLIKKIELLLEKISEFTKKI